MTNIPNINDIDPDLLDMFKDIPNKAIQQTTQPIIENKIEDPIKIARSLWMKEQKTCQAFDAGVFESKSIKQSKGLDTFVFNNFNCLKSAIDNEIGDLINGNMAYHSENINYRTIFYIIFSLLFMLNNILDTIGDKFKDKIEYNNIIAYYHGFITSYMFSNFKKK